MKLLILLALIAIGAFSAAAALYLGFDMLLHIREMTPFEIIAFAAVSVYLLLSARQRFKRR